MIELKRCNYITGEATSVSFGISKIIDFFENSGKTPLFLYKKESNFQHLIHTSRIEFKNQPDFEAIITDKSNLFRVDLLIVDLWFLSNVSKVLDYKKILDSIGIDYIIITNKYHYIEGDLNVNIYKLETEYTDSNNWRFDTKYWISDLLGNSRSTMDDFVLAFKRNKKIDDIFGDEE